MAGRKSKPITEKQQLALDNIRKAVEEKSEWSTEITRRQREEKYREQVEHDNKIAAAVRAARDGGVTIPVIASDGLGLGSASRPSVYRWLSMTGQSADTKRQLAGENFSWANRAESEVAVHYFKFPTAAKAADFPEVLEGVARYEDRKWIVVSDPGTTETELGTLPGWFTYELTEGTLPTHITAWVNNQVDADA